MLAATEMLARGIDLPGARVSRLEPAALRSRPRPRRHHPPVGATHVVNASLPADLAAYLHRAGRVGRVGGSPGVLA